MEKENEEFKQLIYDLMNGYLDLENNQIEEAEIVESEFVVGKECYMAYAEILDAYQRVCQKLGDGEEDDDIEIIINNFNFIMRYLCMKMYDYACFFSGPSIK